MEEYRAYVIGPDGHIINRVDIRCADEKEARRLAKIAVDGHAVELWQTDRFIERLSQSIKATSLARGYHFRMSPVGTKRTCRADLTTSVDGGRAEVGGTQSNRRD